MGPAGAEFLAAMNNPNAVTGLLRHADTPAAARAVAQQFGALLMQGLLQQPDGSGIQVADGVGAGVVNSMFATTMGKVAMSGERLGLADLMLRSIEQKQAQQAGGLRAGDTQAGAAATGGPGRPGGAAAAAPSGGLPLSAYWAANGLRPPPAGPSAAGAPPHSAPHPTAPVAGTGLPLSSYLRTAALVLPPSGTAPAPQQTPPVSLPGASGGGAGTPDGSGYADTASFTAELAPLLRQAAQKLGVSPRILLAQAAIETGWGRSMVGNNLFGIKAGGSWTGGRVAAPTHEYENGQLVSIVDNFRAYPSLAASVQDFVNLVSSSPRYRAALNKGEDVTGYAQALLAGGWATDIDYVRKLQAVADGSRASAPFAAPGPPVSLMPANFATLPL